MLAKPNPLKWAVLVAAFLGMAMLGLLTLGMIGALNTGLMGLIVGMILATLPVPFYVMLALWVDRYEKEPIWMLAMAFLWGATVAVFFSFIFNTINAQLFGIVGGATAAQFGGSVISAPFVEETAKALALLLFFFWKKDEFDNVTDGVLYAAMVGLGFAMTENISYYGSALQYGIAGSLFNFVHRGIMAPFAHPLFTAMTGIGLGLARETTRKSLKLAAPVVGLGMAMLLHALWNLSAGFGALYITYLLIMVPAFFAVIGLVVFSHARERKIIRANLQAYVESGALTGEEVKYLTGWGGRLRALRGALSAGGMAGWWREEQFQRAASELAFHRWRTQRGISRGQEVDVARERDHLQRIQDLRARPAEAQPVIRGAGIAPI